MAFLLTLAHRTGDRPRSTWHVIPLPNRHSQMLSNVGKARDRR